MTDKTWLWIGAGLLLFLMLNQPASSPTLSGRPNFRRFTPRLAAAPIRKMDPVQNQSFGMDHRSRYDYPGS